MSEQEFELYLALLSRFLKLTPRQHKDILDELRDHLEQRLEDLSHSGLSREQSIQSALDEFGDAAHLATHFTQLAQRRKRRFIMRMTVGSIAGIAALILVSLALWPEMPVALKPPQAAVAESDQSQGPPDWVKIIVSRDQHRPEKANEARIRAALVTITEANFVETAVRDALAYLAEFHQIRILMDRKALNDAGVDPNDVLLTLQTTGITLRSALDLMLQPNDLDYYITNEVLMITTCDAARDVFETRVYDVRKLLASDLFDESTAGPAPKDNPTFPLGSGHPQQARDRRMRQLAETIMHSVDAEWSDETGKGGVILSLGGGVLVIRQTYRVQEQITNLLGDLQQTAGRDQ